LHDLGSLLGQGLCIRLLRVTGEAANPKASIKKASRNRATLLARRPAYQN